MSATNWLPAPYEPQLSAGDLDALRAAVAALERQSFAARLAGLAGRQLDFSSQAIPPRLQSIVAAAAQAALSTAARLALRSLDGAPRRDSTRLHRGLAALSGGVGGAAGLASLPLELPLSTTIMLRSIADIARHEGENLSDPGAAIACLEVFALGGHAGGDNLMEGGYLAIRALLAKSVSDAARYVAAKGMAQESAPVLVRLVSQIGGRFGVVVSQKAAAQAAPVFGAIGGAAINFAFAQHFQTLARGHFTMRRLGRVYDPAMVRTQYARIAREEGYWSEPG
jgi:hypothetical protein